MTPQQATRATAPTKFMGGYEEGRASPLGIVPKLLLLCFFPEGPSGEFHLREFNDGEHEHMGIIVIGVEDEAPPAVPGCPYL